MNIDYTTIIRLKRNREENNIIKSMAHTIGPYDIDKGIGKFDNDRYSCYGPIVVCLLYNVPIPLHFTCIY